MSREPESVEQSPPQESPAHRSVGIAPAGLIRDLTCGPLADVCSWEWDISSDRVRWSAQLCALLGVCIDEVPHSLLDFLEFVHPDDRGAVSDGIRDVASGSPFEHELRLLSRPGGVVQVFSRGAPISNRAGEIVSVVGFCRTALGDVVASASQYQRDLLLAQAEQTANFGTWEFDVHLRTGTISSHLAHMLGLAPGAVLSEQEYWDRVHPDDRAQIVAVVCEAISRNRPFQYVARYVLDGGGIRHHLVRGLPVVDADGSLKTVFGITLDFSEQTHAEGELHRLSQQLLRARDDERRNIARELHESTGQTLAALKMSLGRLREALAEDDEIAHSMLRSAVDLADDAVREVRTISYLMHPPMLDEAGLSSALRWYAKGFSERSGISVHVDVPQDFGRHGREIETTVFRIVQEALTNVHRYSGSRTASIRLCRENGSVRAEIHDDGCGLPAPVGASGRNQSLGVGIVGMRERVKLLNGNFEMDSAPGKGTTVRVLLPIVPVAGESR
jgi:signal transduction histidine kinase